MSISVANRHSRVCVQLLPVEQRSQPFDKPVHLHCPYPTLAFNRASYSLQRDLARMMRVLRGVFSSLCDELLGEVFTYLPSFESLVVGLPDNKLAVDETRGELRLCSR